jgi:membrane carboxypeptidase/penicillin-binding protein
MYKNFNLTESERESILSMHQAHGYKKPLNEVNSQAMAILQQETQTFNEAVDEDLTPEEYKEVMCSDPNEIELPQNLDEIQKQTTQKLKIAMSTATRPELVQAKQQIKDLKNKQQQAEQVAAPAVVTILGVSMNPGVAIAIGLVLFVLVLSFLGKLFRTKRTTYYCDGTRSRGLFGLLRW